MQRRLPPYKSRREGGKGKSTDDFTSRESQTFDVDFVGVQKVSYIFDGNLGISNHANMLILGLVYGSWIWGKTTPNNLPKKGPIFPSISTVVW